MRRGPPKAMLRSTLLVTVLCAVLAGASYACPLSPADARARGSAEGGVIAFGVRDWDAPGGENTEIFLVNADGSGLRNLTQQPDTDEGWLGGPAWSPDGSEVAFPSSCLRVGCEAGIYVIRVDGTSKRRLTSGESDSGPVWSPDGQTIAFNRDNRIYGINPDGSGLRLLTRRGRSPAWAPDSQKIAFGRSDGLYVMNSDGSEQRKLAGGGCSPDGCNPSWSADGRKLAYARELQTIHVLNVDGKRLLTALGELAIWSPRGGKIALVSGDALYVMNANGTGRRRLARFGQGPAWSPDGGTIAFTAYSGPKFGLSVINADGSGRKRLAELDAGGPAWSPTG